MKRNVIAITSVIAAALVVVAFLPAGVSNPPEAGERLIGTDGALDTTLVTDLGGSVLRQWTNLDMAQVWVPDVAALDTLVATGQLNFSEPNDPLALAASSWDASSWDASSWDASSWDASSWDASSWDASSWDASSWDASSWDASSWDASSWDASSWDASSWDASSWDASSWDASSWDSSSWDASSWDASSWDASSWDASSWDASSWDGGTADELYAVQWGLGAANFPDAWTINTGQNRVGVCVLDTGVDTAHPDLRAALWQAPDGALGHNAMLGGSSVADDVGHGTHVAGILAAVGGNGLGIRGAATERVMNVKVMGANGGTEADLAEGLVYCVDHGARLATMSLHTTSVSPAIKRAIAYADQHDVLMIAAAGNDGASSPIPQPASDPRVIAVGALTPSGAMAGFTNTGPQLELLAPGYRIASTAYDPVNGTSGYAIGSGTSQATPFVAAAAALMFDERPDLDAGDVRSLLADAARDLGDPAPALDAGAAMTAAVAWPAP